MSMFENAIFNSTLYEALYLQIEGTLGFARDFFHSCVSSLPLENLPKTIVNIGELSLYEEIAEIFYFNEFQCLLLKTFSLILLFTLLLIFISWRVYGNRISERFMRPGEFLIFVLYNVPYKNKSKLYQKIAVCIILTCKNFTTIFSKIHNFTSSLKVLIRYYFVFQYIAP